VPERATARGAGEPNSATVDASLPRDATTDPAHARAKPIASPWLTYAEAAPQLGLTEGAVKVAVHRLRSRYRELLRAEVAKTVATPSEVDEELQHLIAVLTA